MNPRYFNLKIGKPNVFGGVIKVNPEADLEKRLNDFLERNPEEGGWSFRLMTHSKTGDLYEIVMPNVKFGSAIRIPSLAIDASAGYSRAGRSSKLMIKVTNKGNMSLYKTGRLRAYLSEISEKEARKAKADKEEWINLQRYVCS